MIRLAVTPRPATITLGTRGDRERPDVIDLRDPAVVEAEDDTTAEEPPDS